MQKHQEPKSQVIRNKQEKNSLVVIICVCSVYGVSGQRRVLQLYNHLAETLKRFKGMDCIKTGDFNAKLGKQPSMDSFGAHARGTKNEHWQQFPAIFLREQITCVKHFFMYRACHITTWEGWINIKKVYNQADYIVLRVSRSVR